LGLVSNRKFKKKWLNHVFIITRMVAVQDDRWKNNDKNRKPFCSFVRL
jgi:hypothetical protein